MMLSTARVPASISVSDKMEWIPSSLSNKRTRSITKRSGTCRKIRHTSQSARPHAETDIDSQQMSSSESEF